MVWKDDAERGGRKRKEGWLGVLGVWIDMVRGGIGRE